jgi:hypothetical protein
MNRILTLAALALSASLPLAAQEEAPRHQHYRYRVETPYRDFGRMGREYGRMGREYGRMGREYARMYSRDFSRQWSRQDFGRGFRFILDRNRGLGQDFVLVHPKTLEPVEVRPTRLVEFRAALPKSAVQKILRRELVEEEKRNAEKRS